MRRVRGLKLCKRIPHCCATLRRSRNKRNVGSCWLKSLTGFKLCATTCNRVCNGTQHVTSNSIGSCSQLCCIRLRGASQLLLRNQTTFSGKHACVSLKIDETCVRDGFFSLRKQPFLLALRRRGRFARRNVRETSSAAKSEEKRLFSHARFFLTVYLMIRTPLHVPLVSVSTRFHCTLTFRCASIFSPAS